MFNKNSPEASSLTSEGGSPPLPNQQLPPPAVLLVAALVGAVLWSYWGPFVQMGKHWLDDPQYSHGWLVPVFALALLGMRRPLLASAEFRPSWWGLIVLTGGIGLRLFGAIFNLSWFEQISLLPALAGLVLLVGGWPALRWSWPAIAFLAFMMPLPYFLETMLARQLRQIATITSTYAIVTIGLPALSEGTDILLNEHTLRVAPACSGLGMLLVFFALSTGIALVSKRPWLDRLVIVASAVPIAVIANVVRITTTAVLYEFSYSDAAQKVIHDWAGYFMMLVALVLLWLELKLLGKLFIVESAEPVRPPYVSEKDSTAIEPHLAGAAEAKKR